MCLNRFYLLIVAKVISDETIILCLSYGGMTMRQEKAVSEVIGAVLLIGVVMLSIGIIGVILLSTPPPENTPKASLTSYCVQCDLDTNYEIIIYHGGGDLLERKETKFFLYCDDGSRREIVPWWVYTDGTPEDCMFYDIGDSSLSSREYWGSSFDWKSGQTLRFRERLPKSVRPVGMDILYYPFRSPMVKISFKDQIKTTSCVVNNDNTSCSDPRELIPVLISPKKRGDPGCNPGGCAEEGACQAQFMYFYHPDDDPIEIPVHSGGKPWNKFYGNDTSVNHKEFDASGSMTDSITVSFSQEVQWWLGRTKSEVARCT